MKTNRKYLERLFVRDEDAVSPVIAVILMVAITVVLAATVFVLVSDLGSQKTAPAVNLEKDESNDRLVVKSAADNADWNRIGIIANRTGNSATDSVAGARFALNAQSTAAGAESNDVGTSATAVSPDPNAMSVAEYIDFCGDGSAAIELQITVVDTEANSELGSHVFRDLALCE